MLPAGPDSFRCRENGMVVLGETFRAAQGKLGTEGFREQVRLVRGHERNWVLRKNRGPQQLVGVNVRARALQR